MVGALLGSAFVFGPKPILFSKKPQFLTKSRLPLIPLTSMNAPVINPRLIRSTLSGFTLVELLAALAIVAITASFAVPSINNLISNARMVSETNKIVEALNIARSKAVSARQNTVIAPITAGNWNGGVQVFLDLNNNQALDIDNGESLQNYLPPSGHIIINSTYANRVVYRPDGRSVAGSFNICSDSKTKDYRHIAIALSGRIRTSNPNEHGLAYGAVCP